jgi:flagellar FliL protein
MLTRQDAPRTPGRLSAFRLRRTWTIAAALLLAGTAALGEDEANDEPRPPPNYVELKPAIVANLNGGPKYIRCDVQLMTTDAERVDEITLHAAALRHEILLLLPDIDGASLTSHQGKEALRSRLLAALQGVLERTTGQTLVEELYFTSFYVQ